MPKISNKGIQMPESPIRKLVPYAEIAKKKGHKVYHLNIGQPDIKTPEVAMNSIKNLDIKVLEYSHSAGFESYRTKLSQFYKNTGLPIEVADIIITTGGSEALLFAMGSTMDFGDEVIIPEPFYANYSGFSTASGVKVVPVISTIETGFALPPIADFERLITSKTKAILICNPGNPTGYLYSKEEIMQLADLVKKHDLFLIADEVYREFTYDGDIHYSVMNIPGLEENAIMIGDCIDADVRGAIAFGMQAILFDEKGIPYLDWQMWYSAVNFGYKNKRITDILKNKLTRSLNWQASIYIKKKLILLKSFVNTWRTNTA